MVVQPQVLPVGFEYTGQTQGSREVEVRARVTGILLARNYTSWWTGACASNAASRSCARKRGWRMSRRRAGSRRSVS